jgi:hypothetical protein
MEPHKEAYNALISVTDHLISADDHTKQYKLVNKYENFVAAYKAEQVIVGQDRKET